MGYGKTAHNRSVNASPPVGGSASVRLAQSAYGLIRTAHSGTFGRHANLTVCFIVPPKRRQQPERYVQLGLKFVGK
jgi:hypothetical protein